MRWVWSWAVLCAAGCAVPGPARFASWDPVRSDIPRPGNRAEARARLSASYALWKKWRASTRPMIMETGRQPTPDTANEYSYVRARQTSLNEVAFTLFVVKGERVVLRALMTADPSKLSRSRRQLAQLRVTSRWVERNGLVGRHEQGAPAKTVDQLYAECDRLIDREATPPRLYFDPEGLLMQCGYPPEECSDCESASVLSISRFSVRNEAPRRIPAAWLCEAETGVVLPGSDLPLLPDETSCVAAALPTPPRPPREPAEGLGDICVIDPNACPQPVLGLATWLQIRPAICPSWPEHAPRALEVGKSDPLADWTFPFSSNEDVECGASGMRLKHIRPPQ